MLNWIIIALLIVVLLNQFVIMCDINDMKDNINYIIFKLPSERRDRHDRRWHERSTGVWVIQI